MRKIFVFGWILVTAATTAVWTSIRPTPDQKLEITEVTLSQLRILLEEPKYKAEPDTTLYTGVHEEPLRLLAQSQLNHLIRRLLAGLEAQPTKRFVLREFRATIAESELVDTEDRERFVKYLKEITDIVGLESSEGVLSRGLYGPVFGPLMYHMSKYANDK